MAASVPFTDPRDATGDGSPRPGSMGRSLEFLGRLRRAIGLTGFVWGAAAALLGVLSLAIALFHGQVTREMADMRGNRAIASNVINASNHLSNALIAVQGATAGSKSYARLHPPLFEWADAARHLRPVCARPQRGDDDSTLRIDRICAAFQGLEPAMLPALTEHDKSGAAIGQDLLDSLTELVWLTDEASTALRLELRANLAQLRGAQDASLVLMTLSAGGFLLAVLILFFLVGRSAARHHAASEQISAAHAKVQQSRRQLLDAIEALPSGFALYDRDERLVLFNSQLGEMTLGGLSELDVGRTYEELVDRVIERLRQRHPDQDYAAWRAENIARFRGCAEFDDQTWEDGRTVRVSETRTQDGGTVAIRIDVTALKQREEQVHVSGQRYNVLVKSLADVVFSLDRSGRLSYTHTHTGAGLSTITGYSPEELRGRTAAELWHPDDRVLLMDLMGRLRTARGKVATQVMRLACKDGSYRFAEVRVVAPEKSENLGGELAMTGVIRDIHAQHELALHLRDRMERLNSIVQSTGALFLLVDRELRIVMANNGFLGFAGCSEEQVVGRPLKEVVDCPLDSTTVDGWLSADRSQKLAPVDFDNTLLDVRGERRTLHVTANPVRGDSGRVEHIVFLAVDETERRRTELQLFDASRLATLGEMASGIAHEINQPLTVIRFAADSLQEEIGITPDDAPLGDSRQFIEEKCARIAAQTERAATIIGDLRGFARRPDDAPGRFDVVHALRTVTTMVDEQLRLAQIELDRDLDPACPAVVGHASRLQQVIINLLLNARDAIRERGRDAPGMITIRLRSPRPSDKVVITVEDDGTGIPDRAMPRLFEPFFTTKPTGSGTGLGLSISYQIIRQMGGTITAENRAEGGARFTITLTAEPPAAPTAPLVEATP